MSKKKPEYDELDSVSAVDEEIQKCKDLIYKKVKLRGQTRENKKEATKAYNDELKIIEEELDFNVCAIDELNRHKRLLLAGHKPKAKLQSV